MRQYRKSPRCLGFSSSHTLPFTGVQGRFLASLEMTIQGRRYSHFPPTGNAFPSRFHTASALSAPSGHLPLEGKAIHDKRRSPPSFLIRESFHRKPWTTTPMVSYYFFSQYATSVSAAPMPRAVLMPMPVYMAKEARVAARLAAMSFLKKP